MKLISVKDLFSKFEADPLLIPVRERLAAMKHGAYEPGKNWFPYSRKMFAYQATKPVMLTDTLRRIIRKEPG